MCFRYVQAIDSKHWNCFRLMGHLLDAVLNGSLSFDGIATAAFAPLIVAGGLALLAFILATLAAFQKRPGQQSAKALPNFGTLWILGLATIVLSTAPSPIAQAEATHGYRDAGCVCSQDPDIIIKTSQQPYIIRLPGGENCANGYRKSNVKNCEASMWDWHYHYLCSFEEFYWNCVSSAATDCLPESIAAGVGAGGTAVWSNRDLGGEYNWRKIKATAALRAFWGFSAVYAWCIIHSEFGIPTVNACAAEWSARNWNQWDEFCDGLVRERKKVAEEGEFHDCTED